MSSRVNGFIVFISDPVQAKISLLIRTDDGQEMDASGYTTKIPLATLQVNISEK